MGNDDFPMKNILFDNVKVTNPGDKPWGIDYYYCENVEGKATGDTWPLPLCLIDETTSF
jgi:hypothetical protein